jgi:hypothetical protein
MNAAKTASSLSPTLQEVAAPSAAFEPAVGVRAGSTLATFVPTTF